MLRENIYAERDQPPFDRVAMDGIALASSATTAGRRRFRLQATQAAGDPPLSLASAEHCIEVMTGAVLPAGCDAVVPVEQPARWTVTWSWRTACAPPPGLMSHRRASDRTQGALLLPAGSVLHAPEIAVAASAGMARVRVSSQPAIMVISTGNELVEPGDPIAPHQIRRSNAYAVAAALRQRGFQRVADDHLPDDAALLRERLRLHLTTHEVLILSGGVSMGRFDLVPQVLAGARRAAVCCTASPSVPASRCGLAPPARAGRCSPCRAIRSRRWCAWCATWCRRCMAPWECHGGRRARGPRGTDCTGSRR